MLSTSIEVKTQFEALHCYPNAPEEVMFLRNLHRHLFKVSVVMEVFNDDRELEFFMVKKVLDDDIIASLKKEIENKSSFSCEQMAKYIGSRIYTKFSRRKLTVKVSEDDENAAIVSGDGHDF